MTKLLINEHPLMVLPTLAATIGLNEAIIIQQIHYWIDPRINKNIREGVHWVYNTYKQWQEQFPFFSEITVKRIIQSLESKGLLLSGYFNKNNLNKTKWYTINYDNLANLEIKNILTSRKDQIDPTKRSNRSDEKIKLIQSPIYKDTETTTENTNSLSLTENETIKKDIPIEKKKEREMLETWNEKVEEGRGIKHLTPARENELNVALKKYFNNDLNEWTNFCKSITSSDFLMGKVTKFKASIDWVIKEDSLVRILEGDYGVVKSTETDPGQASYEVMIDEIDKEHAPEFWKNLKKRALTKFGPSTYNSWLSKLEFYSEEQGRVTTKTNSKFVASQIQEKFITTLQEMLFKESGFHSRLEVIVG